MSMIAQLCRLSLAHSLDSTALSAPQQQVDLIGAAGGSLHNYADSPPSLIPKTSGRHLPRIISRFCSRRRLDDHRDLTSPFPIWLSKRQRHLTCAIDATMGSGDLVAPDASSSRVYLSASVYLALCTKSVSRNAAVFSKLSSRMKEILLFEVTIIVECHYFDLEC